MAHWPLTADHRGVLHRRALTKPSRARTQMRRRSGSAAAAVIVAVSSAMTWSAPLAFADPVVDLSSAVAAYRAGSACGPLRRDPIADRVAEVINKSTSEWLDHAAMQIPIEDPLPGLKEFGYRGSKAYRLAGSSRKSQSDSIKALLLQGYAAIIDCSYTDVGFSTLLNERTGNMLSVVVLAGA